MRRSNRSATRCALALALALAISAGLLAPWAGLQARAWAKAAYAAMIMTASSDKVVYADGALKGKRVESMEYLEAQDLVRVPAGETLVVVIFETGMREVVTGPALVQVMASGCLATEGGKEAVVRQPADHLPALARLEDADAQNFGVTPLTRRPMRRATGNGTSLPSPSPPPPPPPPGVTCLSPARGVVRPAAAGAVTFAWLPITGATQYRVTLLSPARKALKSLESANTTISLAGVALRPGEVLHWTVEARTGKQVLARGEAAFAVMSAADASLVARSEALIRTRFPAEGPEQEVQLALLYRSFGLQNEEARALQQALARNPHSEAIRLRLKSLNPGLAH